MLKRWLVGNPLKTTQAAHQRLSKLVALAVFSSDALSSVAYATEEILLVLVLGGTAAASLSIPISLAIVLLLIILTVSYRQIIYAYPDGGGAYIVAKSNLGTWAGLAAAAALIIDYVLTVAVSTAAGIAAVTSAIPALFSHREVLCLMTIGVVVVLNLRGVRESGRVFAVPTYLFIGAFLFMIGSGLIQLYMGKSPTATASVLNQSAIEGVSIFLILRAFSSGCTALTGIEVISNGVSAFKKPEPHNAALTMLGMAMILGVLFVGTSVLALQYGVIPKEDETVVSQIGGHVFRNSGRYDGDFDLRSE
jgi:amino acid transporter